MQQHRLYKIIGATLLLGSLLMIGMYLLSQGYPGALDDQATWPLSVKLIFAIAACMMFAAFVCIPVFRVLLLMVPVVVGALYFSMQLSIDFSLDWMGDTLSYAFLLLVPIVMRAVCNLLLAVVYMIGMLAAAPLARAEMTAPLLYLQEKKDAWYGAWCANIWKKSGALPEWKCFFLWLFLRPINNLGKWSVNVGSSSSQRGSGMRGGGGRSGGGGSSGSW